MWTATDTVDMHKLFGKMKTGKKYHMINNSYFEKRLKCSPLTEFAFNQEESLIEDLVSTIAVTVDPGEAVI